MREDYTKRLWESIARELSEGGWRMPNLTSKTQLTPETVDIAMRKLESLLFQFSEWVRKNPKINIKKRGQTRIVLTEKPLKLKGPSGSTYYYKSDKESGKNVTYGDIDVNIVVPVFIDERNRKKEREEELWNLSAYKEQLRKFIIATAPDEISSEWISKKPNDVGRSSYLILNLGDNNFVQVDLIYSFEHSEGWVSTMSRPEHGLKGFITGLWLSSIGEVLNIPLTTDYLPFYRTRKSKQNISKYLFVNLVFEVTQMGEPDISDLIGYEGLDVDDFTFEYLLNATKRLGMSLEKNEAMKYSNFINNVKSKFIKKIKSHLNSPKFKEVLSGRASKEMVDSYKEVATAAKRGLATVKSVLSENYKNKIISISSIATLSPPIFVLMSGGMGAGKSFVASKYLPDFSTIDVDQEKRNLSAGNINDRSLIRPATEIAIKKYKKYLNSRSNIVYQGISPNVSGIKNKMKLAKENGYTTVLLRVESDSSMERTKNRISLGGHGQLNQVEISINKSKKAFDEMKESELIDYISIYKN